MSRKNRTSSFGPITHFTIERLPGPISLVENLDLLFRSHVAAGL